MDRKIFTGVIVNVILLEWARAYGAQGWSQLPSKHMWKLALTSVTSASSLKAV